MRIPLATSANNSCLRSQIGFVLCCYVCVNICESIFWYKRKHFIKSYIITVNIPQLTARLESGLIALVDLVFVRSRARFITSRTQRKWWCITSGHVHLLKGIDFYLAWILLRFLLVKISCIFFPTSPVLVIFALNEQSSLVSLTDLTKTNSRCNCTIISGSGPGFSLKSSDLE